MTNRKRKWESSKYSLVSLHYAPAQQSHLKHIHLLRVNSVYFTMRTPETRWTAAGTCISSISSQDFQGNTLELQKHLLIIIFSCYWGQVDWQGKKTKLFFKTVPCMRTFQNQHWYSFSPSFNHICFPFSFLLSFFHLLLTLPNLPLHL